MIFKSVFSAVFAKGPALEELNIGRPETSLTVLLDALDLLQFPSDRVVSLKKLRLGLNVGIP